MDPRHAIEQFHLLFLHAFGARAGRELFALKGGCNLRFYWKSIRYSEDLDLDVRTMAVATLRNHVERVLEGPALTQALRAHQLEIAHHSAPKQTETTQRWKLAIRPLAGRSVPTRIEFSRRRFDPGAEVAAVDAALTARYRIYPVLAQRYGLASALMQKVAALAGRAETQARDVFDLKLLLDQGAPLSRHPRTAAAVECAMSVSYDQFTSQVLAYLEPEYQDHYRGRRQWEALQDEVVRRLQETVS